MIIIRKRSAPCSKDRTFTHCHSHCTLNTHGHLDQKRVTVESIGSFVDKGSAGKPLGDDNV